MTGSVAIRRCASVEEALVVCSLLRSGGFDAHLENANHAIMYWGAVQALGGVGILVPATQLDAAKQFMIEAVADAPQSLESAFPGETFGAVSTDYGYARFCIVMLMGLPYILSLAVVMAFMLWPEAWLDAETALWRQTRDYFGLSASVWAIELLIACSQLILFCIITFVFAHLARSFLARRLAKSGTPE